MVKPSQGILKKNFEKNLKYLVSSECEGLNDILEGRGIVGDDFDIEFA